MIDLAHLKSRLNLRDTISEHVRLKKKGRTWWGRCPFHSEKTASFAVHENYYYCHGCNARGDVIDFTAAIERVSKGRAIRLLAEKVGIAVESAPTRKESAYKRDLEAQATFWWARKREAALTGLYAACASLTDHPFDGAAILATAAGARVRAIDSISPEIRGRIFLQMRRAEDRREWERETAWAREFERVWMEIGK